MKKNLLFGIGLATIATVSVFGLAGCKQEPQHIHEADVVWTRDDTYHWNKCKGDDDTIFNKGEHTFVDDGSQKKCSTCDMKIDYTLEENFAYWITGRNNALNTIDNYSVVHEGVAKTEGALNSEFRAVEERAGNKYYFEEKDYVAINGQSTLMQESLIAIKVVDDNGTDRTKIFYKYVYPSQENPVQKSGYYVNEDCAKTQVKMTPLETLNDCVVEEGDTYLELVDYLKQNLGDDVVYTFVRNSDGSVTLNISYDFSDTHEDYQGEEGETYESIGTNTISMTVLNGRLVKVEKLSVFDCVFNDTTRNYSAEKTEKMTYTYDSFDEAYYNSISVETETTVDYTN